MLKTLKEYIPLTTLILIFLYVSGGLYLIGYWSLFNVNVTNFVTLSEIPIVFILPFTIVFGSYIIVFLVETMFPFLEGENKEATPAKESKYRITQLLHSPTFYSILFGITFILFIPFPKSFVLWAICPTFLAAALIMKFMFGGFLSAHVKPYLMRRLLVWIIVLLPICSFTTGRINGLLVYKNKSIKFINAANNPRIKKMLPSINNTRFKLLGFLGGKLIISSFDNKRIVIINQSSVDAVEFEQSGK